MINYHLGFNFLNVDMKCTPNSIELTRIHLI